MRYFISIELIRYHDTSHCKSRKKSNVKRAKRRGLQHLVPLFPTWSFTTGWCTSFAHCAGDLAVSCPGFPELPWSSYPPLWCCSGHHSLFAFSLSPRHCPLGFELLSPCASLLPAALFGPHVVLLSSWHSPNSSVSLFSPSPLPRVYDWSTVVAACHHSLSAWHQSVLAHVSGPLPDFPEHASVLDSLFDSFTRILCGFASHHSRRRPGSRPRTRQPLWWNDACYHALVARNGSWRDFRRSGSLEDQARFRLLRQQFHSTVRSSRTHFWNEWLGSVTCLSHRAPRLACSLVRRTFRSSVVTPDLCHMQRRGASCSALPPDEARSQLGTLLFPTTCSTHSLFALRLSRPCTNLPDLMLPSLTRNSLLHSPRVCTRRGLSKSHSLGGVIFCFPSLTSFCASLWFAWKSSIVVPVIKRDGDPTSLHSYRPISLASCTFKVFEHLVYAPFAPHIFPQLDPSQGGFRWGADAMAFSLVDSLRLRRHEHTFVAFIGH